ncbi:MAG TPA: argininosuccinate synthase, partial [Kineosporiaceae bacterium]|nr:argininosuccinate synthase [Kineosporiaceae bacterium]
IGQLTMRNLDIADTRRMLELYAGYGQLAGQAKFVGELEQGRSEPIADDDVLRVDESSLDRAAFEAGTD